MDGLTRETAGNGFPIDTVADSAESNMDCSTDVKKEDGLMYIELPVASSTPPSRDLMYLIQQYEEEQETILAQDGSARAKDHYITTETDIDTTAKMLPSGGIQSHCHVTRTGVSETMSPQPPEIICRPMTHFMNDHKPRMPDNLIDQNFNGTNNPTAHEPNCPLSNQTALTTLPFNFGMSSEIADKASKYNIRENNMTNDDMIDDFAVTASFKEMSGTTSIGISTLNPIICVSQATTGPLTNMADLCRKIPLDGSCERSDIHKEVFEDLYSSVDNLSLRQKKMAFKSKVNDMEETIIPSDDEQNEVMAVKHSGQQSLNAQTRDLAMDVPKNIHSVIKVWNAPNKLLAKDNLSEDGYRGKLSSSKVEACCGGMTNGNLVHFTTELAGTAEQPTEGPEGQRGYVNEIVGSKCIETTSVEGEQFYVAEKGQQDKPPSSGIKTDSINYDGLKNNDLEEINMVIYSKDAGYTNFAKTEELTGSIGKTICLIPENPASDLNQIVIHADRYKPYEMSQLLFKDNEQQNIVITTNRTQMMSENRVSLDRCSDLKGMKATENLIADCSPPSLKATASSDVHRSASLESAVSTDEMNKDHGDSLTSLLSDERQEETQLPGQSESSEKDTVFSITENIATSSQSNENILLNGTDRFIPAAFCANQSNQLPMTTTDLQILPSYVSFPCTSSCCKTYHDEKSNSTDTDPAYQSITPSTGQALENNIFASDSTVHSANLITDAVLQTKTSSTQPTYHYSTVTKKTNTSVTNTATMIPASAADTMLEGLALTNTNLEGLVSTADMLLTLDFTADPALEGLASIVNTSLENLVSTGDTMLLPSDTTADTTLEGQASMVNTYLESLDSIADTVLQSSNFTGDTMLQSRFFPIDPVLQTLSSTDNTMFQSSTSVTDTVPQSTTSIADTMLKSTNPAVYVDISSKSADQSIAFVVNPGSQNICSDPSNHISVAYKKTGSPVEETFLETSSSLYSTYEGTTSYPDLPYKGANSGQDLSILPYQSTSFCPEPLYQSAETSSKTMCMSQSMSQNEYSESGAIGVDLTIRSSGIHTDQFNPSTTPHLELVNDHTMAYSSLSSFNTETPYQSHELLSNSEHDFNIHLVGVPPEYGEAIKKPVQDDYGTAVRQNDHAFLEGIRNIFLEDHHQGFTLVDSGIVLTKNGTSERNGITLVTMMDGSELGMTTPHSKVFLYYQLEKHFCITKQISEYWYYVEDRITKATMLMKKVPITSNWMKLLHNFLLLPEYRRRLTLYAAITDRNGSILFLMEARPLLGTSGSDPLRIRLEGPIHTYVCMQFTHRYRYQTYFTFANGHSPSGFGAAGRS